MFQFLHKMVAQLLDYGPVLRALDGGHVLHVLDDGLKLSPKDRR
jgi:hypothetical protein